MKILVVDDDKEIVELLSIYLKNEGYEPIAAYSGKEALTKLSTNPEIALMILDIMMPQMSGIEVIKEVRKDSEIPILVVAVDNKETLAFMGIAEDKLEMLFITAQRRGQGIGRNLLEIGINDYEITEVCVNEQNPQALAFYEYMGFTIYRRSELDEQGNPFPILFLHRQ